MPLKSLDFDASTDRTKGGECPLGGAWFQVVGDVPVTLRFVANDQSGIQFAIVPYQVYVLPFRKLFMFHAASLAAKTFTVLVGGENEKPLSEIPNIVRTSDFLEIVRTPNVFKQANGTVAGALWTPAAGKRFRMMGYRLELSGNAAITAGAGLYLLTIADGSGGTVIGLHRVYLPAAAPATPLPVAYQVVVDMGNGFLSGLAGRAVDLSLGGNSLVAGQFQFNGWGTEE